MALDKDFFNKLGNRVADDEDVRHALMNSELGEGMIATIAGRSMTNAMKGILKGLDKTERALVLKHVHDTFFNDIEDSSSNPVEKAINAVNKAMSGGGKFGGSEMKELLTEMGFDEDEAKDIIQKVDDVEVGDHDRVAEIAKETAEKIAAKKEQDVVDAEVVEQDNQSDFAKVDLSELNKKGDVSVRAKLKTHEVDDSEQGLMRTFMRLVDGLKEKNVGKTRFVGTPQLKELHTLIVNYTGTANFMVKLKETVLKTGDKQKQLDIIKDFVKNGQ